MRSGVSNSHWTAAKAVFSKALRRIFANIHRINSPTMKRLA
jgi:hypothetical protein